jgi:hypothetical protein
VERNKLIQELIIVQRQIEQVGSKPALETIKHLLKTLAAETPCQRNKCDHYHQCQVCEDSSNFTIMGG